MAKREWGRNIGAQSKQIKKTETDTERKLKDKIIKILVATTEKKRHTGIGWTVKRKEMRMAYVDSPRNSAKRIQIAEQVSAT